MQYKLFFHEARLLLVLFIATHFLARQNIEENQSRILLNVRFVMLKIIFQAAFTA
ncbi:Uncharacterised protein [Klebsiella pneumoniae]|uniref:Uncharacterized protein n=1 Tax=Klebsiella pneumoniae TaxID=573 RepID=A0A3S5DGV7_KLEPN|nr:Uncharacterised protein [Klebsiella pneumoniae]VTN22614.1 Uncharacterised protein [Klebsiella pneumoniae]